MDRRAFLGTAAGGMGMLSLAAAARGAGFDPLAGIEPVRASPDRLFRVTVCLRPFRAPGPRIEVEQVGRKRVVHNYGHGGSGWSLSWGSAELAVPLALADGVKDVAVIGAGAVGMAAALTAQRAGATVTIYAKEQFPYVRSARATGTWSPDSRIAMKNAVDPGFGDRWEGMARASFSQFQSLLGLPGDPVEWTDRYMLSDTPMGEGQRRAKAEPMVERPDDFLHLESRLHDITPRSVELAPGTHPFRPTYARRNSSLTFNIADLSRRLTNDFLIAGGKIVPMTFNAPSDVTRLPQKSIINCTGYGARSLWRDESIVPVRGQIAWLIPQPGLTFGVFYGSLSMLARRDGIVVQEVGSDEWFGYGDANEEPDRAAAEASVRQLAQFWA
ncbi:glycine/D-amino acid oxidase-like deaminating enzyme [Sphingobium sp. OAS761]|uniref:FAD-dependent oxidoreductase n=1 Tax=Sphingobium sp. OAS761 TaxID=2817901 RepID=UPI0020A15E9E|nr:FAD-dependent oxidoreductase [Sphingobium sp. OAS761]MCP1469999.1 glycine/D-amino acid oxidase-like deaminating enzyme [Sphingobium sp. OAS761]